MAVDKTKHKQVLVTFPIEVLERIENYKFEERIDNRNEAIRRLVTQALDTHDRNDK